MGFDYNGFQDYVENHPEDVEPGLGADESCGVCHGTGYVPGTETEHTWGDRCPNGCPEDMKVIREQGQG